MKHLSALVLLLLLAPSLVAAVQTSCPSGQTYNSATGNCYTPALLTIDPVPLYGLVTVPDTNLACGGGPSVCFQTAYPGNTIHLHASSSTASFSGWGGACSGTADCYLKMDGNKTVSASFAFTLTINPVPTTGWIDVIDASGNYAIMCGSGSGHTRCSGAFAPGTKFHQFMASANTGSAFSGWTGDCSGNGPCSPVMDGNKTISANFPSVGTKTISIATPTGGRLLYAGGLYCPSLCAYTVSTGWRGLFTPEPAPGYVFGGWGGVCSGSGDSCSVTINSDVAVSASFTAAGTYTVTIPSPPTNGEISGPGINCGYQADYNRIVRNCSAAFTRGSKVHFDAFPSPGRSFAGWTGACSGQVCTLTIDGNKTLGANFP